jgi:hypothetical protein
LFDPLGNCASAGYSAIPAQVSFPPFLSIGLHGKASFGRLGRTYLKRKGGCERSSTH